MIRVGLLGCGRVSARYQEIFSGEVQGARVSAVCDLVESKAQALGGALGVEKVYTSTNDFWADPDIDLAVILTESGKHFEHTLQGLKSGKHVLVEKPMVFFPDQADQAFQLSQEKNLMLAHVLQNRLNPSMQALKKAVDGGRFGKRTLASVRLHWCRTQDYYEDGWHGTWSMDGGVINQQALHHIDALQWIAGKVRSVVSSQTNSMNQLEAEDTTVAALQFESGALGTIEATTAARPRDFEASLTLIGEKGLVKVGGIALNEIVQWEFVEKQPEDDQVTRECSQEVPTGYGLSHGPLLQEVVNRLSKGETTPPIAVSDAKEAVSIIHALYRSVEQGSWVEVNPHEISQRLGRS